MSRFLLLLLTLYIGSVWSWSLGGGLHGLKRCRHTTFSPTNRGAAVSLRTTSRLAMSILPPEQQQQTIELYTPEEREGDEKKEYASKTEEIHDVIDQVLAYGQEHKDLGGFDPNILLDHAHIITHGRLYEDAMNDRMQGTKDIAERLALEKADALMRGFITAERKQRARLKVVYVLAGAQSGDVDDCIKRLSDCEQIDEDLMKYLERMIRQEQLKANPPSQPFDAAQARNPEDEERVNLYGDGIRATLSVLRMVHKLLKAEVKVQNKEEVRLLSTLLNEKDPEMRYVRLTGALQKVEQVENFADFVTDGIDYLKERNSPARRQEEKDNPNALDVWGNLQRDEVNVKLPVGVVEQMKDILLDVQAIQRRLKTGLSSGALYSTDKEDYVDKGPLADYQE